MAERVLVEFELSALGASGYLAAECAGREILLIETGTGLRVYSGVCPHLGGPLAEGQVTRDRIRCPWHGYEFDTEEGACLSIPGAPWRRFSGRAPANQPFPVRLVRLPFRVNGTRLQVLATAISGTGPAS